MSALEQHVTSLSFQERKNIIEWGIDVFEFLINRGESLSSLQFAGRILGYSEHLRADVVARLLAEKKWIFSRGYGSGNLTVRNG